MDAESRLARSRKFAIAGFLALITAFLLPWWGVTWNDGQTPIRSAVYVFRAQEPLTTSWAPVLSGVLAVAAAGLMFVRIAARSEIHEPDQWARRLRLASGLIGAAVVTTLLWPNGVPSFWGGRTYALENGTGPAIQETAMPMLGWWLAILALAFIFTASWLARPTIQK